MAMSTQEQQLCEFLRDLPHIYKNRYNEAASQSLLSALFWSLARGEDKYMRLMFPEGTRAPKTTWKLREAQGAVDGAEYTEVARGKACGHIFKSGEATYRCKTCSADETCVLCSRCYDSSDHTGHMVYIAISPGNSGCCDCGDPEAWRFPVHCTIHSEHDPRSKSEGKAKEQAGLQPDLIDSIHMTIGRAFDYICDVISCSPEQLRIVKTANSIKSDERLSRLTSSYYSTDILEDPTEYALLLWNDEKHTVNEVRDQVARACKVRDREALLRAHEIDDIGRSILMYDTNLDKLLHVAKTIEQIKVTVTIRSARDTFREQMCSTIIEWLGDISGCSVGGNSDILRYTVCEEMLKVWRTGSEASNAEVGKSGLDDHERDDRLEIRRHWAEQAEALRQANEAAMRALAQEATQDDDNEVDSLPEDSDDERERRGVFGFPRHPLSEDEGEVDLNEDDEDEDVTTNGNVGLDIDMIQAVDEQIGGPIPNARDDYTDTEMTDVAEAPQTDLLLPPPPPMLPRPMQDRELTPSDSDTGEPLIPPSVYSKLHFPIPKTPKNPLNSPKDNQKPGRYWLETPEGYTSQEGLPVHEDLRKRVRLDWLILFDLRMWKKVRVALRDLYLFTVVNIPQFKRVLGLRFAALYTTLAQLYLIADREPDHSIINISLQMLTTPSITAEIVERGNFMTSLMAILYTFLTTRQVGHPFQIFPNATLAFEAGSVTNRRMYHFFVDLRYLFSSNHIQERLRSEPRYTMQFLDLVKLHQGICPNTRAVGEHVEYETDAWISASLITREINRLCRQFAESFKWKSGKDITAISRAIRTATKSVIINSVGAERRRFSASEIKDEIKFKRVSDYEMDTSEPPEHQIVRFVVDKEPISFHHALHYTLSWLIEGGKGMSRDQLLEIMSFTSQELAQKPRAMGLPNSLATIYEQNNSADDNLMAAFDYSIRVCAWLAQMKANMWVRNGMSLRHQAATYRGVGQRDVSHHRDIFLIQTAMVLCSPARVLTTLIDRFGVEMWMKGIFEAHESCYIDDAHLLDVTEDLIHLLIVLLSDRTSLLPSEDSENSHVLAMRRDITHVLCFKPLSFSEICSKLPDKFQEQEECQDILDEMTIFKAPEGLSDVGTFELKPQFLEDIDPYIAHYNKNQREESENAYRTWMAQKLGKKIEDVVYEPKLRLIETGVFADLASFTRTGMFAQIVYYSLLYPLTAMKYTPNVPTTRVETFLQVILHLVLIAISEDKTDEDEMSEESLESFVYIAMTRKARSNFLEKAPDAKTIVSLLEMLSMEEAYRACHPKIMLVLKRMKQKRPQNYERASYLRRLGLDDRINTASPASDSNTEDMEEKKKKMARERQAKVMAQFQQKQKEFMDRQGGNVIDWGEADDEDEDEEMQTEEHKNLWKFPSGTCILCQEETNETRPYGTFAMMMTSSILRQTDLSDPDFVEEVCKLPSDLDRYSEPIRPFGISGENREQVRKVTSSGEERITERQFIGKGFPHQRSKPGPVTTGCGHIMHYKCFEAYYQSSRRRHQHQIARHHPERLDLNEFCCPLCKALGNAFLPIIWRHKEEVYPGVLQPKDHFINWLMSDIGNSFKRNGKSVELQNGGKVTRRHYMDLYQSYNSDNVMLPLASKMSELLIDAWETSPTPPLSLRPGLLGTPGAYPADILGDTPTSTHQPWHASETAMPELVSIYRRLKDTMIKNGFENDHRYTSEQHQQDDLCYTDILAKSLGLSISALEIQQRGVGSPDSINLLEKISQQALTHLRVLSETATSYVTIGGLKLGGENRACREFSETHDRQMFQLFIGHPHVFEIAEELEEMHNKYPPLLREDPFIFLANCSVCLSPVSNIDMLHIVRLLYLAELVRVVLAVSRALPEKVAMAWMHPTRPDLSEAELSFSDFCKTITRIDAGITGSAHPVKAESPRYDENFLARAGSFRSFVQKYALTFLRKSAILLHVRFGVDFSLHVPKNTGSDELARLTEALALPSFDHLCASITTVNSASPVSIPLIQSMVEGWMYHHSMYKSTPNSNAAPSDLSISHPVIFELIGLPKNYDTLMEESTKRRCPTTGKDITDPMICLFCGEIFCGQANCCLKEVSTNGITRHIGGAQQHMKKCQHHIGLFISIRKCTVYYLFHNSGSWMVAPYIDKYGEVDPGLRHMRQLYLNQKRYDALLRTVWLQHGVPSVISRKLEADINNGGWETI